MILTPVIIPELDFPPPCYLAISILIENVLTTKPVTMGDKNEGNDQERRSTLRQTQLKLRETSLFYSGTYFCSSLNDRLSLISF